jgi:hypothetical protein
MSGAVSAFARVVPLRMSGAVSAFARVVPLRMSGAVSAFALCRLSVPRDKG